MNVKEKTWAWPGKMDVDEISLELFKPTVIDSLKWNQHDNIMAALSDTSLYFISLLPDNTQSRFVLNITGPKIVRICWSSSPVLLKKPWGQIRRMVLFVLNCEGRLQAWSESSSSIFSRWELCSQIDLETVPLALDSFEDRIYIGDSFGNVHFVHFRNDTLFLDKKKLLCKNEPVTKISASRTKLAFAHGPHKVSCYNFDKKVTVCLIEHACIGTPFLNWTDDALYAIKYNQLFQVAANGDVSQKELGFPGFDLEDICGACLSPDGKFIWLAVSEGNIYKYECDSGLLTIFHLREKSASSRTLGFCSSSSGRTLAWLSVDANFSAKIVLADSGFVSDSLPENDTGVWEALRYRTKSCTEHVKLKRDLFSTDASKRDAAIRDLSLLASKKFTQDETYSSAWSAFQRYLENPASKWAALKNFSPETCPDCCDAQVLFESFTEAKCQNGHVLNRCSATFACLGSDEPFQKCDGCNKAFKISLFESCPYCSGRLFHVS